MLLQSLHRLLCKYCQYLLHYYDDSHKVHLGKISSENTILVQETRSYYLWYSLDFLFDSSSLICASRSRGCHLQSEDIYIDITAALRAVFYIARVLACNIKYLHEGASPRRRYFRIARRAQRARVLYDNTALKCEDDIVYIHQRAFHQVDMEYI